MYFVRIQQFAYPRNKHNLERIQHTPGSCAATYFMVKEMCFRPFPCKYSIYQKGKQIATDLLLHRLITALFVPVLGIM